MVNKRQSDKSAWGPIVPWIHEKGAHMARSDESGREVSIMVRLSSEKAGAGGDEDASRRFVH